MGRPAPDKEAAITSDANAIVPAAVSLRGITKRFPGVVANKDVDIDVRIAGLDIDPGFVWWLGAVVGFRYV